MELFFQKNSILEIILGITLVSFHAIFLNIIFNRNEFYEKNIFLPSLIYATLMSSVPGIQFVTPLLIANTFIIVGLYFIYKIKRQEDAKKAVFMNSIMLGIASCFYPPYILFFIIPIAALIIIRPFQLKEYLLVLLGFLLPWIYFFAFGYLFNNSIIINLSQQLEVNNELNFNYFEKNKTLKISLISTLVLVIILGVFKWRSALFNSGLRFKRLNQLNAVFFLTGVAICVFEIFISDLRFNVLLMAIPLTLVLPFGFTFGKNTGFTSFLWYIFMILSIINIILY